MIKLRLSRDIHVRFRDLGSGFPQIRGYLFGVARIRVRAFFVLYCGQPIYGHTFCKYFCDYSGESPDIMSSYMG